MNLPVIESYEGKPIPFRAGDAFVNATEMCAAFGKRPTHFLQLESTKEFIAELERPNDGIPVIAFRTEHGGSSPGTWLHPDLALECARWLSPKFAIWCNRVIRKILSGEEAPGFQIPKTLSEALRLAGQQAAEAERLALENASMRPKAEFVDNYVSANGNKSFRQVVKLLGANERRFREFLEQEKIMYRLGGEWMPYQQHLEAKRFAVKAGVSRVSEHAYNDARFTPKGVEWIAGLWAVHNLRDQPALIEEEDSIHE